MKENGIFFFVKLSSNILIIYRKQGLSCLRQQLNGDELLVWTIETFTMFYDKTWAQSYALPLLGLIPVFLSISTFVYDYYSDFELTFEYYQKWNTSLDVNSAFLINNASTIYALKDSVCFVGNRRLTKLLKLR